MYEDLLPYYRKELHHLRENAGHFAKANPDVAGRLLLSGEGTSGDPMVERLLEGFAFLTARVHRRMDDAFPEITQALLDVVAPHLVRTFPARGMVQMALDPDKLPDKLPVRVPRGSRLQTGPVQSPAVPDPLACTLETACDLDLWPLHIESTDFRSRDLSEVQRADVSGSHVLTIRLKSTSQRPLSDLAIEQLEFMIHAEAAQSLALYDMIHARLSAVLVGGNDAPPWTAIRTEALEPVGMEPDALVLGGESRVHPAYRLLQEYFLFPRRFLGFRLHGLREAFGRATGERINIYLVMDQRAEDGLDHEITRTSTTDLLRLGCVPTINLFTRKAAPIALRPGQLAYPLQPDPRRPAAYEVNHVLSVDLIPASGTRQRMRLQPMFNLTDAGGSAPPQWQISRRVTSDGATDTDLHVVGLDHAVESGGVLDVQLLCTNRDLLGFARLTNAKDGIRFSGTDNGVSVKLLGEMSAPARPPLDGEGLWRLISHLSLNHLSLLEPSAAALKDLLRLYANSPQVDRSADAMRRAREVDAICGIAPSPAIDFTGSVGRQSVVRGIDISLKIDPEKLSGGRGVLLASILERFFGGYATINSFTRTSLTDSKSGKSVHEWPARSGTRSLI